jgi:inosine/xanthosine triphosphatase
MKILVGSANPVKLQGVREAFAKHYDDVTIEGVEVPGAPDMPFEEETLEGARHRAQHLRKEDGADFYVGVEGGVAEHGGRLLCFGITVVLDKQGREGLGLSPHFPLPPAVADQLKAGKELGPVMDALTGGKNTKQQGGACGYFTRGAYLRKDQFVASTVMALCPFLHEGLYFPS